MLTIRKTGRQDQQTQTLRVVASLMLFVGFVPTATATIGDGTTAGNLRTNAAVTPKIGGVDQASLISTDDLWDLSAEVDTIAATRRAYFLYSDGTFDAGVDTIGTDVEALQQLPAFDEAKSIVGVYVAGPATDFDDAGGLAAQGTISNQVPAGAFIGIPNTTSDPAKGGYVVPQGIVLGPV